VAIDINPAHKGMLHRETHTKAGQKISLSRLMGAKHSADPAERRRATFALNARSWNHA